MTSQDATIEKIKVKLPEYRRLWRQVAHDSLEELCPKEYKELSRPENSEQLQDRISSAVATTESVLLSCLSRGMPLYTALEIAESDCLKPLPELEKWEQEYLDSTQVAVAEAWLKVR